MCAWQFVRTTCSYASWAPAIVSFAMCAKWRLLASVSSTDTVFATAATYVLLEMRKEGIHATVQVQFTSGAFDTGELGRVAEARMRVIVVLACSLDVVTVALAAKDRGMLEAGHAWLGLDTIAGAEEFAADGPKATEVSKAALHGWVYFQPSNVAPAAFFDRVREATRARFPAQPGSGDGYAEALSSPFAANMYDAVMLYAVAVASSPSRQPNGEQAAEAMRNVSFDGMTGRVALDENGDMKESIRAMNYLLGANGTMRSDQIGVYDGSSRMGSVAPSRTIMWPGAVLIVPLDVYVERTAAGFSTSWVSMGAASGMLVLLAATLAFLKKRYGSLRDLLVMVFTEVADLVGSVCMDLANVATDWITCYLVLSGTIQVPSRLFKATYAATAALGTVAAVVSVGYRVRNVLLVRQHVEALAAEQAAPQSAVAQSGSAVSSASQSPADRVSQHAGVLTAEQAPPQGAAAQSGSAASSASQSPAGMRAQHIDIASTLERATSMLGRAASYRPKERVSKNGARNPPAGGSGGASLDAALQHASSQVAGSSSASMAQQENRQADPARQAHRYEYELKQSGRALVVQSLHLFTAVVEGTWLCCSAMSFWRADVVLMCMMHRVAIRDPAVPPTGCGLCSLPAFDSVRQILHHVLCRPALHHHQQLNGLHIRLLEQAGSRLAPPCANLQYSRPLLACACA